MRCTTFMLSKAFAPVSDYDGVTRMAAISFDGVLLIPR
jgi:hypothetical protein